MLRIVVAVSLLLATGCVEDRAPGAPVGVWSGNPSLVRIRSAANIPELVQEPVDVSPMPLGGFIDPWLSGDLGEVIGFDGTPYIVEPRGDEGWTSIELWYTDEDTDDVAMTVFVIEGGIDHPDLAVPGRREFRGEDPGAFPAALHIKVLGCSWPAVGISFDDWANVVTVNVEPGETPDEPTQIDFTAEFPGGYTGQAVEGSFSYRL